MTIKPIDLQSNIAHMHEIAKGEHGRSAAFIEGQQKLDKDAEEEAQRIRNKLEQNKHAEKNTIMREEGFRQKKGKKPHHEIETYGNNPEEKEILPKDENIGRKIDVKR